MSYTGLWDSINRGNNEEEWWKVLKRIDELMKLEEVEMKRWLDSDDTTHYMEAVERWYTLSLANQILFHNRVDLKD